ncbi:MAG: tetratricopeptide repeat protein [Solirubrobacterales bacterium]|nr:tetratricopeptide repeat protein [Solirubrobacterales bacterium]
MTVIDVNEADFAAEVLNRSSQVPVVVDFWAPWCAPCRQLGPALEKAAEKRDGKVVLAKIDTDENPNISRQFGIQGIPAVKAFRNGNIVAEFVGAKPAVEIEGFFDALVPSESQILLEAGDEASLRKAIALDKNNGDAAFALAQLLYRRGETDAALEIVGNAPGNFRADGLAARIELETSPAPGVLEAFCALDEGEIEDGLDKLLALLANKNADGERIRRVIVAILDDLGVQHPLARETRRKLAAALY